MFDPSIAQIIAYGVTFTSSCAVATACWYVRGRFTHKWKLAEMDKECRNQLMLERERKNRPQRQLDRPRPPPSR